jgi:hypothetical protein
VAHLLRGPDKEPDPELRGHRFTALSVFFSVLGGSLVIIAAAFQLSDRLEDSLLVAGCLFLLLGSIYWWKYRFS